MDTDDLKPMKTLRSYFRRYGIKVLLSVALFIAFAYLILFTPIGNRLLAPAVEKSLSSLLATPIEIDSFTLSHNRFSLEFRDSAANIFETEGGYSLMTLSTFGHYHVRLDHPLGLNPLNVPLHISGSFSGGSSLFDLQGEITGLGGSIVYKTRLDHLSPAFIRLQIHDLDAQTLLHQLDYPSDTSTRINGTVNLSGFIDRNIKGDIALHTRTAAFSPTPILEDSNGSFDLASLLTDEKGYVKHFTLNVTADLDLEEAGILEQLAGIHLKGPLKLSAVLTGNQHDLIVDAHTDLAHGKSRLLLAFQRLQPQHLHFTVAHARSEALFSFLNRNAPIGGIADGSADFNLTGGEIRLDLREGITYPDILKHDYNLTQPEIAFTASLSADLSRKGVHYRGSFRSNLARTRIEGTTTHDQMLRELLSSIR